MSLSSDIRKLVGQLRPDMSADELEGIMAQMRIYLAQLEQLEAVAANRNAREEVRLMVDYDNAGD